MDKIKEIVDLVSGYIESGVNFILNLLSGDMYILYGAIGIILAIVIIAGLIACLKKIPKLFIALILLLGIIVVVWYFVIYKTA